MDVKWKALAAIYCVLIIIITSDFIMNLILGVLCNEFKEVRIQIYEQKMKEMEEEEKKQMLLEGSSGLGRSPTKLFQKKQTFGF